MANSIKNAMNTNDISVITPVYNAEKYVRKAVESAVHFDVVKEIILVEDKSPDNALQVCQELEKEYAKVKLYQHTDKQNHGAGPSRNLGIEKATADWIAFLDADDYYLPNRFDAEIQHLFNQNKYHGMGQAIGGFNYVTNREVQKMTTIKCKVPNGRLFDYLMGFNLNQFDLKKKDRKIRGHFSIDGYTFNRKKIIENKISFPDLTLHQDTVFILKSNYYLNPIVGKWEEPVAMRGVHEENRITAKKKGWQTNKIELFDYLIEWMKQEGSKKQKYTKEFYARKIEFETNYKNSIFLIPKVIIAFFLNQRLRFQNRYLRCLKNCLEN